MEKGNCVEGLRTKEQAWGLGNRSSQDTREFRGTPDLAVDRLERLGHGSKRVSFKYVTNGRTEVRRPRMNRLQDGWKQQTMISQIGSKTASQRSKNVGRNTFLWSLLGPQSFQLIYLVTLAVAARNCHCSEPFLTFQIKLMLWTKSVNQAAKYSGFIYTRRNAHCAAFLGVTAPNLKQQLCPGRLVRFLHLVTFMSTVKCSLFFWSKLKSMNS